MTEATPAASLPVVVAEGASPGPLALINPTAFVTGRDVDENSSTPTSFVTGVACFNFINRGPRPVTKATFAFSAVDTSGSIVKVDSPSANGLFAVNDITPSGLARAHVCLDYTSSTGPAIGRFLIGVRVVPGRLEVPVPVAEVLVSASMVTYDDGSTWKAQRRQVGDRVVLAAIPSPSPVLPGWPIVRAENVAGAPFRVRDAFTYVYGQTIAFQESSVQFGVCAALDAADDAKAKQAQVAVAYIAGDGTVAAVDTITMYGAGDYGECRSSPGAVKDGTFVYNIRRGAPSTPIARVIVTQVSEDFADGTKWTSPAAPVVGAQLP